MRYVPFLSLYPSRNRMAIFLSCDMHLGMGAQMTVDVGREAEGASHRSKAKPRPFRLLDAIILTAATAIGCAGMRWVLAGDNPALVFAAWIKDLTHSPDLVKTAFFTYALTMSLVPFCVAWTICFFPIRLAGPRSTGRRLARQPGMAAACASGVALAFLTFLCACAAYWWGDPVSDFAPECLVAVPVFVGLAVLVSWTTLLLGRTWRSEPSWIDRLGRAFGFYWIVAALVAMAGFGLPISARVPVPTYAPAPSAAAP